MSIHSDHKTPRGPFTLSLSKNKRCHGCSTQIETGDQFWGWDDHVWCSTDCIKRDMDPEYGNN